MHRFFTFIFSILFATLTFAQASDDNTLKFLGIPIDGTREHMIAELEKKDFTYDQATGFLHGQFNGQNANVLISTNHGVVDRIYVSFTDLCDGTNIKVAYNNLQEQFNNNRKYVPYDNEPITDEENIMYQMNVKNRRYQSTYILPPVITDEERKTVITGVAKAQAEDDTEALRKITLDLLNASTGRVWFMINELQGKYYIGLYYDNLKNRPHGEDL